MKNKSILFILISILLLLINCSQKSSYLNKEFTQLDYCDVLPILEKSCLKCHNTKAIAPFSFENPEMFKRKKTIIMQVLDEGIMPPWKPDPTYSKFKHEYFLTEIEKTKLYTWIHNGAARNDSSCIIDMKNIESIKLEERGDCFTFNLNFEIPENIDYYHCFTIPNPYNEDVKISTLDLIPGNISAIHHISAFIDNDASFIENCLTDKNCNCDHTINSKSVLLSNWTKGSAQNRIDSNFHYFLPKDSYLKIQIHYAAGYKGLKDSSKVCFNLNANLNSKKMYCAFENNFDISFKANEIKYDTLKKIIEEDIYMTSIWPHTHNLAKKVECYAFLGIDTIPLIKINDWDYKWQSTFDFIKPIFIQKDYQINMVVLFDNSKNNPKNPNKPIRLVEYGRQASDEMLTIAYNYYLP